MTIKSDKWITDKCRSVEFFARVLGPEGQPIGQKQYVPTMTLDKFPEMKERVLLLQPGQAVSFPEHAVEFHAEARKQMIVPFHAESVRTIEVNGVTKKIPSYGLSSFGYDIRLARNFKVLTVDRKAFRNRLEALLALTKAHGTDLTNIDNAEFINLCQELPEETVVDMLALTEDNFTKLYDRDSIVIPPGGFVLAVSEEHIALPRNVSAICMAKSTWARSAITAEVTPLEAGWEGFITIEITNKSDNFVRIHAGIGCMQLMFFEGEQPNTSYAERGGKYMNQPQEPVVPIM